MTGVLIHDVAAADCWLAPVFASFRSAATHNEANALMLFRLLCGLDEALREGWAEIKRDM
jgi:hypothetical protein